TTSHDTPTYSRQLRGQSRNAALPRPADVFCASPPRWRAGVSCRPPPRVPVQPRAEAPRPDGGLDTRSGRAAAPAGPQSVVPRCAVLGNARAPSAGDEAAARPDRLVLESTARHRPYRVAE